MTQFARAEDSPGFLLWHVTLRWQRDITVALQPFGLTHVQFVLLASLWWLNRTGRRPTQSELAEHSGVDTKMLSQVVRTLERKHLVDRAPDTMDARARRLTVTDTGAALAPKAMAAVERVDQALLAPLSTTARVQALRILRVLAR